MRNSDQNATTGEATQTLLVVDGEVLLRLHICSYLRECGFKVIEAASSDEALVVLQGSGLTVDIVLSDAGVPGQMDGFGLSQWLRANQPAIPVILVGSPGRAVEAAADLCEAGPTLSKPYEPEILLDRIRRTLAERKPLGQSGGEQAEDGTTVRL